MKATYLTGYIYLEGKASEKEKIDSVAQDLIDYNGYECTQCGEDDVRDYTRILKTFETTKETRKAYKEAKKVLK